ncbi:MAG: ATP-binding protein [Cryobacterium sp.]|nr:ATP-binding protein [Oligoflexia bacterium]
MRPSETDSPRIFTLLNGVIDPRFQEVEISSSFQIPHFQMIGLPGPEVSEAKDRIRSAIESSGLEFPKRKIVLNLSPASERKNGTGLDLAMAIAVILETDRIEGKKRPPVADRLFAWAELGLSGRLKGVGSPARALAAALLAKADVIFIAEEDSEIFYHAGRKLFPDTVLPKVRALSNLAEMSNALLPNEWESADQPNDPRKYPHLTVATDLPEHSATSDSKLLPLPPALARLLEIAAAGAHHFLLLGPKGIGKSLALEWFLALQPELEPETLRIRAFISEMTGKSDAISFRRVSPQAKPAALIGSFSAGRLRPGEFSLAHGGVLLADEFPEWHRDAREALREPLERKKITITRVEGAYELPCDFIFAGNGNLCPCGGVPGSPMDSGLPACRCLPADRARYFSRLSGPILDRLDLVFTLRSPPDPSIPSRAFSEAKSRVWETRARLKKNHGTMPGKMTAGDLEELLTRSPDLRKKLDAIRFTSFRDRHKTLRLSLTLAALHGREAPGLDDFREARLLRLPFD